MSEVSEARGPRCRLTIKQKIGSECLNSMMTGGAAWPVTGDLAELRVIGHSWDLVVDARLIVYTMTHTQAADLEMNR